MAYRNPNAPDTSLTTLRAPWWHRLWRWFFHRDWTLVLDRNGNEEAYGIMVYRGDAWPANLVVRIHFKRLDEEVRRLRAYGKARGVNLQAHPVFVDGDDDLADRLERFRDSYENK